MKFALDKILPLRRERLPLFVCDDGNPYCVSVKEEDGSVTRYFFGIPIRSPAGRYGNSFWTVWGDGGEIACRDGTITLSGRKLSLTRGGASCEFLLPDRFEAATPRRIIRNYSFAEPTPNGLLLHTRLGQGREYRMILCRPYRGKILCGGSGFSVISPQGDRFVTVSGIASTVGGHPFGGGVEVEKRDCASGVEWTLKPSTPFGSEMLIDVAFPTSPLFLTRTEASRFPTCADRFGSGALLGKTERHGNVRMYAEWNTDRILQDPPRRILSAKWHVPCHNLPDAAAEFESLSAPLAEGTLFREDLPRFCADSAVGQYGNGGLHFDLTAFFQSEQVRLRKSLCGILKTTDSGHFLSVSTANSNGAPQILELRFSPDGTGSAV